jgi:hypothetical protein
MAKQTVEFQFITGLKRRIFRNPRLIGSWDNWVEARARVCFGLSMLSAG